MTQRDAIPDTLPLTASAADTWRASGEPVAPSRLASQTAPVGGKTSAHRAAARLAWALCALTLLLLIGYIPLRLHWYAVATTRGATLPPLAVAPSLDTIPRVIADIFSVADGLAFATLGALIVSRARERRIGWLYCAMGLVWATDYFTGVYAITALLVAPGSLPVGLAFAWIQTWTWVVAIGLGAIFLPLLYPTGRLLSRRWRPVAVFAIGLLGGGIILVAVAPGPLGNYLLDFQVSTANPLGIAALGPVYTDIAPIAMLLLLLLTLLAGASLLLRLRRSRGDEREQLKWFAYVIAVGAAQFVTVNLLSSYFPSEEVTLTVEAATNLVGPFAGACLPLLTGLAILKYRLYDIDRLINRTLVYGALTACVVGVYVLVVGALGVIFQARAGILASLLATGVVALLFQPLRGRAQRSVNRLLYGERDEPYAVVTRLSRRLEGTLAPEAVLPTIVDTIARALKLPYVAISLRQENAFAVVAHYGAPLDPALILPLSYQGEVVGQLLLTARATGEALTAADRHLLDELARHAGLAAHAVQLTADLQRSRGRLVTAREEERRRLRRDLHDGLGSALTSVAFQLDAACNLLDDDPRAARALLMDVKGQTQATIADIRHLVYNLRPPILDEWGLVAALREQVAQYQLNQVQVTVDAPEALPALPAAVEVAAYRIALEGLSNVIRHAAASRCVLRLDLTDEALILDVQDNGRGLLADYHAGVGVSAMRERAAELGGSCVIENMGTGGARVYACLPLAKE
jgi:two-component system, NarL family, sensor kinase